MPMVHRFRRGPSRLLWFVIGGVAVSWWMKAKERKAAEWRAIMTSPYPQQQQVQQPEQFNEHVILTEQSRETASKLVDETIEGALSALDALRAKLEERKAARGVRGDQSRPT
ncbi:hypothetical protein FRB93_011571 [Tulasnella sp. JGI-2019a]|nr:hypothetical protein FRB93_011571 [Tulasnella sp. JGI-2019a]